MKLSNQPPGIQSSGKKRGTTSKRGKKGVATVAPSAADLLAEASRDARLMQAAVELAKRAPDIRENKVDALKKKIAAGEYRPDARKIADALVDDHIERELSKRKR